MPTAAVGIDKPVGIERGPGYPGGNGLLTASVYADGLTAAVGIAPTSWIRVARRSVGWQIYADGLAVGIRLAHGCCHVIDPRPLPRHRSVAVCAGMPTPLPSSYLYFFIYIIYFFLFFFTT